jgi:type IV pilus assembly protein PilO
VAMTKEQQQQVIVAIVLPVVIIYLWWNYLMAPWGQKISEVSQEVVRVEEEVDKMKRIAVRKESLERERDALFMEVGKAEKKLPKQKNIEELIRIVTELSQKNRIFVANFSPENERQQNYYTEIPFGITYTASFHSLGKFLASLGQQERILAARNLNMSFSSNPKRGHTVSGSFSLLAYVFRG